MSAPQHSPDHLSRTSADASIDADRTGEMQSWLDAPNFDLPDVDGDDTDEWAAIDDHDRLLVDGHLSDLGVSVLADLQVGVVDAAEGLDPQAVQSSILHLAHCSACPARVASIAGWAREIALPVPHSVADPVGHGATHSTAGVAEPSAVLGNIETLSPQHALQSSSANPSGDNVVSIDAKRRRFVSPRGFASAAAALAACAFAATTVLNSSPKVASTDLAIAETTIAAAAAESAVVSAAETTALAASETIGAAAPADQSAAAARVAPAAESAPDTDPLANDVLSFDGETGSTQSGSSETSEPAPPPAAKKSAPKATFPVTTVFQPDGSSERAGTTAPLLPEGRLTTTGPPAGAEAAAGATAGVAAAAPAPPITVVAAAGVTTVAPNVQTATPSQDAVVLPTLLQGTFLNVQVVRDKLLADPTIASPDTEGPCGKELRAWLISSGAEQAGPRFIRARVADRVLTFAIATPVGKPAVVVVADEACRQLT